MIYARALGARCSRVTSWAAWAREERGREGYSEERIQEGLAPSPLSVPQVGREGRGCAIVKSVFKKGSFPAAPQVHASREPLLGPHGWRGRRHLAGGLAHARRAERAAARAAGGARAPHGRGRRPRRLPPLLALEPLRLYALARDRRARVGLLSTRRRGVGLAGGALAFTRYSFTWGLVCRNQPSFQSPGPPALPILVQYYCTINGQYTTPLPTSRVYALHHTILVITISCKGQVVLELLRLLARVTVRVKG